MGEKLTRRAALACLGSGALAMGLGSSAFTSVEADRDVSVAVSNTDPDALLGIDDQSNVASVSGPDDSALVFELTDNSESFTEDDISVEVLRLISDGTVTENPPISADVDASVGSPSQFGVTLSCDSGTDTDGTYEVVLQISAETSELSVTAERTTEESVSISCTFDYENGSNYNAENGGGAKQPANPKGNVENPNGVSQRGGTAATAESTGGGESARVGWRLPTVPDSDSYALELAILKRGNVLTGTWVTYLVDSSGERLTSNRSVGRGDNNYSFTGSEAESISNNRNELYLIFETTSNGNNNRAKIDFFELRAT